MVRVLATCLLTAAASVSAFSVSSAWQGMDLARACRRKEYVYGARSICAQAQDSPRPRAEKKEEMRPIAEGPRSRAEKKEEVRPIAEGLLTNLKDRQAMTGTELDQDSFANRPNFDIVVKMRGNPEDILEKLGKSGLMTSAVVDTVIMRSDKKRQRFGTKTEEGRRRLKDRSYFGTPLWQLVLRRSSVLTVLMMMQSLSSLVLTQYEELIQQNIFLSLFLTMLTGTGGNAGNQSSAIIIRGISTGEINSSNMLKAVGRELAASLVIAAVLAAAAYARVLMTTGADSRGAVVVSAATFVTVVLAIAGGTLVPLATLTDVIGVLVLCVISSKVLAYAAPL